MAMNATPGASHSSSSALLTHSVPKDSHAALKGTDPKATGTVCHMSVSTMTTTTSTKGIAVVAEPPVGNRFNDIRTYALTALIKDGLSQSLPSEKLLMKSQIASLSASFLTR